MKTKWMIFFGFAVLCSAIFGETGSGSAVALSDFRDYLLEVSSNHGETTPAPGLYTNAYRATISCSAEPVTSDDWLFMGWSGDATSDYTQTNVIVVMNQLTKSVAATFSDDADGDGLLNTTEWTVGGNPRLSDTDSDGFDDAFEFSQHMPLTNDNSAIATYMESHSATFGLYSSSSIHDLDMGHLMVSVDTGTVEMELQLQQTDDLASGVWTNAGSSVTWSMPVTNDAAYFRVHSAQ